MTPRRLQVDPIDRFREAFNVPAKEYLSPADLARIYAFPSVEAVWKFLRRHREIPTVQLGRRIRVERGAFERATRRIAS